MRSFFFHEVFFSSVLLRRERPDPRYRSVSHTGRDLRLNSPLVESWLALVLFSDKPRPSSTSRRRAFWQLATACRISQVPQPSEQRLMRLRFHFLAGIIPHFSPRSQVFFLQACVSVLNPSHGPNFYPNGSPCVPFLDDPFFWTLSDGSGGIL